MSQHSTVKQMIEAVLVGTDPVTLLEAKLHYLGQCDKLRMQSKENEQNWQSMMQHKRKISLSKFKSAVDTKVLLDPGESIDSYLKDRLREDPSTAAYESTWGSNKAVFLQTAGFEFIWID